MARNLKKKTLTNASTLNRQVILNPHFSQQLNISLSITTATAAAALKAPIFTMTSGNYGSLLYALSFASDSNTQANYSFMIDIAGVAIDKNTFQQLPISQNYNIVPSGICIKLPMSATIKVYAYYSGNSGVNGLVSIAAWLDELVR